eukprot:contig_3945_g872
MYCTKKKKCPGPRTRAAGRTSPELSTGNNAQRPGARRRASRERWGGRPLRLMVPNALLIRLRVHELVHLLGLAQFHLPQPPIAERIAVNNLWRLGQGIVNFHHRSAHRGVQLRGGLDRLDRARGGTGRHRGAHVGQLHVHDVTQLVRGVGSDANGTDRAVHLHPLVRLQVLAVSWPCGCERKDTRRGGRKHIKSMERGALAKKQTGNEDAN